MPGVSQQVTGVPGGEWRYFAITLPNQTAAVVAEVRRSRGDPILFLKGASEGEEVGLSILYKPLYENSNQQKVCHLGYIKETVQENGSLDQEIIGKILSKADKDLKS